MVTWHLTPPFFFHLLVSSLQCLWVGTGNDMGCPLGIFIFLVVIFFKKKKSSLKLHIFFSHVKFPPFLPCFVFWRAFFIFFIFFLWGRRGVSLSSVALVCVWAGGVHWRRGGAERTSERCRIPSDSAKNAQTAPPPRLPHPLLSDPHDLRPPPPTHRPPARPGFSSSLTH